MDTESFKLFLSEAIGDSAVAIQLQAAIAPVLKSLQDSIENLVTTNNNYISKLEEKDKQILKLENKCILMRISRGLKVK